MFPIYIKTYNPYIMKGCRIAKFKNLKKLQAVHMEYLEVDSNELHTRNIASTKLL